MIARIWRGWVKPEDAAAYADYTERHGLVDYRRTPGNRGAWLLQRRDGERTEIIMLSFWDSYDAIKAFAGADITRARFYPEDDRFLVAREWTVTHHEVVAGSVPGSH